MADTSHLPLKLNMRVIRHLASSIILPGHAGRLFLFSSEGFTWLKNIAARLTPGKTIYFLLSIGYFFFLFFYTALVFNPRKRPKPKEKLRIRAW